MMYHYFYPRSPCGERQPIFSKINTRRSISIHALLAESDSNRELNPTKYRDISIHALLAESDTWPLAIGPLIFISIHALLAESDCVNRFHAADMSYFYPRSPCGERLNNINSSVNTADISIHALLAESDLTSVVSSAGTMGISIHALLAESDELNSS